MVFGTDEAFTALCGTTKVFMDGTFYMCPVPFYQLFVLHYLDGDRMIPAPYVLFTTKTAEIYTRFWTSSKPHHPTSTTSKPHHPNHPNHPNST
jgi:hypothetical protein